CFFQNCPRG
nr:vasopressin,2-Phe [Metatheria]prf//0909223B phenypressin [Setonix brachyurus]